LELRNNGGTRNREHQLVHAPELNESDLVNYDLLVMESMSLLSDRCEILVSNNSTSIKFTTLSYIVKVRFLLDAKFRPKMYLFLKSENQFFFRPRVGPNRTTVSRAVVTILENNYV
jgi:hypothetical protein